MIPTNPIELFSPFLPTTYNFPEDQDDFRSFLNEVFCDNADVTNDKMVGAFTQDSGSFSGAKFIYDTTKKVRNGFQAVVRVTSFIPQTISILNLGFTSQFVMTHVYGTASLPSTAVGSNDGDYFSFFSQGDVRIQFTVSDREVVITTNGTTDAYQGFIILSYLKDGI